MVCLPVMLDRDFGRFRDYADDMLVGSFRDMTYANAENSSHSLRLREPGF